MALAVANTLRDVAQLGANSVVFAPRLDLEALTAALSQAFAGPVTRFDTSTGFSLGDAGRIEARLGDTRRGCVLVTTLGSPSRALVSVLRRWVKGGRMPPCVLACDGVTQLTALGRSVLELFPVRIAGDA